MKSHLKKIRTRFEQNANIFKNNADIFQTTANKIDKTNRFFKI